MTTSPDPASAPADDERRPTGVVERRLTALHDALSPIREACHRPAVALAFAAGLIVVAALLQIGRAHV